jgi:hypothetical protein
MILTIQPMHVEGRVLTPMGDAWRTTSDYLNSRRAVVMECKEKNWEISPRSETLARCVSAETIPDYVAKSEGGILLAIWVGGAA